VAADAKSPLDKVSVSVAPGASGTFSLYEDDGVTSGKSPRTATTRIRYTEHKGAHVLRIAPTKGSFRGQASHRTWTVSFLGVDQAPKQVHAGAAKLTASAWHYDTTTHALRITLPAHSIHSALTIAYQ
jgi:hypothetical protein